MVIGITFRFGDSVKHANNVQSEAKADSQLSNISIYKMKKIINLSDKKRHWHGQINRPTQLFHSL